MTSISCLLWILRWLKLFAFSCSWKAWNWSIPEKSFSQNKLNVISASCWCTLLKKDMCMLIFLENVGFRPNVDTSFKDTTNKILSLINVPFFKTKQHTRKFMFGGSFMFLVCLCAPYRMLACCSYPLFFYLQSCLRARRWCTYLLLNHYFLLYINCHINACLELQVVLDQHQVRRLETLAFQWKEWYLSLSIIFIVSDLNFFAVIC